MHGFDFVPGSSTPFRLLCLGAHSDDIEIGAGGLVLELLRAHRAIDIVWVVFSAIGQREKEARRSATLFTRGARRCRVETHPFRDGFFPYDGAEIKEVFEGLKRDTSPDLVLTHYRNDRHQDHRVISDLTWNTFRDHLVLEYEIPKFDGDLGVPNFFVPIDRRTCARKVRYLHAAFDSQRTKHWFEDETFIGLMRLRGMECRAPAGYAEAFYGRKIVARASARGRG
jgi:LmbE family N-acetylglucosaminyl deacetylase